MKYSHSRKKKRSFITNLFTLLQTESSEMKSIIHWSEKGDSFVISEKEKFCYDVMPFVFKLHSFSSFQRNLNSYGFQKMYNNQNKIEFAHPFFLKNDSNLLYKIQRKRKKIKLFFHQKLKLKTIKEDNEILSNKISDLEKKYGVLNVCKINNVKDNLFLKETLHKIDQRQIEMQNLILFLIECISPEFKSVRNFLMKTNVNDINFEEICDLCNFVCFHKKIFYLNKGNNGENKVELYNNFMDVD